MQNGEEIIQKTHLESGIFVCTQFRLDALLKLRAKLLVIGFQVRQPFFFLYQFAHAPVINQHHAAHNRSGDLAFTYPRYHSLYTDSIFIRYTFY